MKKFRNYLNNGDLSFLRLATQKINLKEKVK